VFFPFLFYLVKQDGEEEEGEQGEYCRGLVLYVQGWRVIDGL